MIDTAASTSPSKAYLGIVDDFTGNALSVPESSGSLPNIPTYHGQVVQSAAKIFYDGPVALVDTKTTNTTSTELYEGGRALIAQDVSVINLSWGSGWTYKAGGLLFNPQSPTHLFMRDAFMANTSVVVAAGNNYVDLGYVPTVSVLANDPLSITVSALASTIPPKLEPFSQMHPGITQFVVPDATPVNGTTWLGTSFAAPRVSGLIAELQERHQGTLTQAQIHSILEQSSDLVALPTPTSGRMSPDIYQMLDFSEALRYPEELIGKVTTTMRVDAAYEIFLNRNPDAGGLEYWTKMVDVIGLAGVVDNIRYSPEALTLADERTRFNIEDVQYEHVPALERVQALYHLYLNREADDGGLMYWTEYAMNFSPTQHVFAENAIIDWEPVDQAFLWVVKDTGVQLWY